MVHHFPYVLLLQSPSTSLPNCLCPFFQHVQTTLIYPFVCSSLRLPTPRLSITHRQCLNLSENLPFRSLLYSFAKSFSFTAQVSLTERTTLLTYAWKTLPFVCSENTLEISTGKKFTKFLPATSNPRHNAFFNTSINQQFSYYRNSKMFTNS